MMQVLYQRLASQEEIKVDEMVAMIEAELQQVNNLVVKKRAIKLLVRLSDFEALQENTQA
jgi:hypothetical protein